MNEVNFDAAFDAAERGQLREHGIVAWAGRVIFAAQPPMDDAAIERVQAQCAGALPASLRALWKTTAGGALDYDLSLHMEGQQEAISFTELFYDGSDRYHDLAGWIEHELDLADEAEQDAGESFEGRLTWLPIGGFEYLDRIYVCTRAGDAHGEVVAWKQGLPPAWRHHLHVDAVASVAASLEAAFARLRLFADPLQPDDDFYTGQTLLEYLDERVASHGLPQALADRLFDWYRGALLDWRAVLAAGALADDADAMRVALQSAIRQDDTDLLQQCMAQGARVDAPISGGAQPVAEAVLRSAWRVLQPLLDAGAPVERDALLQVQGPMPASLAKRLLDAGAEPLPAALANLVAVAANDAAAVLLSALRSDARTGRGVAGARLEVQSLQNALRGDLKRVQSGKLSHWLGEAGLRERIDRLQVWLDDRADDDPAHAG